MVCSFRAGALAHYFSLPSLFSQPTLFHHLFVAKKVAKSAGLVLAAGRSNARFTKPLKTHSSSLHPVAPSSSNTTRFAPPKFWGPPFSSVRTSTAAAEAREK